MSWADMQGQRDCENLASGFSWGYWFGVFVGVVAAFLAVWIVK